MKVGFFFKARLESKFKARLGSRERFRTAGTRSALGSVFQAPFSTMWLFMYHPVTMSERGMDRRRDRGSRTRGKESPRVGIGHASRGVRASVSSGTYCVTGDLLVAKKFTFAPNAQRVCVELVSPNSREGFEVRTGRGISDMHQFVQDHVRQEASGHVQPLTDLGEVMSPKVSKLISVSLRV